MYLGHFGLLAPPFSITPDPRFVFLGERHRDALAHLLFGIEKGGSGGFIQLTGEVGTGKTTVCRLMMEQLPAHARVALLLNPRLGPVELLEAACEELGLPLDGRRGNAKALVDALNAHLLDAYARGLRVVLVIDEAQALSTEALEQLRLLTNLETSTQKLLQVALLGQPELRDLLARPELRPLAQRITARFHLTPLSASETGAYLRHRWRVAGGRDFPFDAGAVRRLHAVSGGVPRLLNVTAERALLGAYARDSTRIDARLVGAAAREALAPSQWRRGARARWPAVAAAALLALGAAGWWAWPQGPGANAARAGAPAPAQIAGAHAEPAPPAPASAPGQATPATSPVPVMDEAGLATRIRALSADRGATANAWRGLLRAWSLPEDADAVARAIDCPVVLAPGAYCMRGRARLDVLARQGRPALLLLDAGGATAWARLLGVDALRARLAIGGEAVDVDRLLLERHWQGVHAGLWRAPDAFALPAPDPTAAAGMQAWIRARLAPQAGDAAELPDAKLPEAVRAFQRERGLQVDGVVGPATLMALAANDPGPRLATELR